MHKVAVFVNPEVYKRPRQHAAVKAVAALLRHEGLDVTLTRLGTTEEAVAHVRAAIDAGCDTLFSCGGDGTVFALLQGLAGTGVPLGIIPMGTGNILAQNMRLSRNPVAAARALLRGVRREVPLGRVTTTLRGQSAPSSWYFASAAGMGVQATLMQAAGRWGKRFSGRAAYYLAGFELLSRHHIEPFEIAVTTTVGETFTQHASEVVAVRVASLNLWRPGGDLDLPLLRLATVNAKTRWDLTRASIGAFIQRPAPIAVAIQIPGKEVPAKEVPGSEVSGNEVPALTPNGKSEASSSSVSYHDASRLVCRPIEGYPYQSPPLLQVDGEVLDTSEAIITMAEETLTLLWPGPPAPAA